MAVSRRRARQLDVWPGYVDALSSLLMVVIFLLMLFSVAQFFMSRSLSEKDSELGDLNQRISEVSQVLGLSESENSTLRDVLAVLSEDIASLENERESLLGEQVSMQQYIGNLESRIAELTQTTEAQDARNAALQSTLQSVTGELNAERQLSASAQAQIAQLTGQLRLLRTQLEQISEALAVSEGIQKADGLKLEDMSRRLNLALAGEVNRLREYRSEFFGRLREALADNANVRIEGDRFVLPSELLFPSGRAQLGLPGQAQLRTLATTLTDVAATIPEDLNWILRIDGHTDKVPVTSGRFASNWELSAARAINVVQFLQTQGIAPERLAATGFGEHHPIDPGTTPQAYANNRRIELKFTSK